VIIARNGTPVARLVPLARPARREPGGWEGRIWTAPDFDGSDAEIAALMLGEEPG
jgi:antitoxin (DNA-binding transcriptional repressor) of toxin-antitoxin stability system